MVNNFIKVLAFTSLVSALLSLSHLMSVAAGRYKVSDKALSPHSIVSLVKFDNSVSVDSMCHKEHENHEAVNVYCNSTTTNKSCMKHDSDSILSADSLDDTLDIGKGCKMMWFAALHESKCNHMGSYQTYYSVALKSALANAPDSLQPVLILGRFGMDYENSTEHRMIGRWAESQGVRVVYSPRLSFQDDVLTLSSKPPSSQGAYLRLDIPKFINESGLLDMPNVCQEHVLYTDVDVVFANRITKKDIRLLSSSVGQGMISYGREHRKEAEIANAGVMVIHVERFAQELPNILQMGREQNSYPNDQALLNIYKRDKEQLFSLLPMQYNWKPYWGLAPSDFADVKILHFHGPKPSRGLDEIAKCNVPALPALPVRKPYAFHIHEGICCDYGRTADWAMKVFKNFTASLDDLCDIPPPQ